MTSKIPDGTPYRLPQKLVEQRTTLGRTISKLCEVTDFKLVATGELTSDRLDHVKEMLDEITVHLMELIEIKKIDGFFGNIIAQAPERQHTVDQIMVDHDQLLVDLEGMKETLSDADHAPTVRRHLHGWLTRFLELDSREVTLLQEVCNVDLGMMD